jgi:hypothetical protein
VEPPPPLKGAAKTQNLYRKLYRTVHDRPEGYIDTKAAMKLLGGPNFSGPISTWLQKGQVEAVIVANITPPTKGLPGRLMISKSSLIARREKAMNSTRGYHLRARRQ